jgi:exopolysaccharide biosynthesis polyprenyl glycosylphosphotransferase
MTTAATLTAPARARRVWPGRATRGWRHALLRRLLAVADVSAAVLASLSLVAVSEGDAAQLAWSFALIPFWVLLAKLLGLYDRDERVLRHLTVEEAPFIVVWALIGVASLALFLDLTPAGRPDASGAIVAGAVAAGAALVLRALARHLWRAVTPRTRVAVVGSADAASVLRRKLELFPDMHATIVAVYDPGAIHQLTDASAFADVDRLCVAPPSLDGDEVDAVRQLARAAGLKLSVIPPRASLFGPAVRLHHLAELPLLEYSTGDLSRSTLLLKRSLDVAVSALALVLLSPLFLFLSLAILLDSRGPVVFCQRRAGLGGSPFRMCKFRSMVSDAEARLPALVPFDTLEDPMFKLRDDPRVTRVGRVLRRWSLDELPQLWNVLKGDMSLVGPRPEQVELVERYAPEHRFRLSIKPGMTGPMQVYGRGELTFAERIAVEADYIDNLSLGRDLRILGMTFAAVLGRRGAY